MGRPDGDWCNGSEMAGRPVMLNTMVNNTEDTTVGEGLSGSAWASARI